MGQCGLRLQCQPRHLPFGMKEENLVIALLKQVCGIRDILLVIDLGIDAVVSDPVRYERFLDDLERIRPGREHLITRGHGTETRSYSRRLHSRCV